MARLQCIFHPFISLLLLALLTPPSHALPILKYNVGGFELGDYLPDPVSYLSGVDYYYRPSPKAGLTTGNTHRWAGKNGFSYNIPTGPGSYVVQLVFAEIFKPTQAVGKRLFNVAIEDKVVLKNFDVFKEAGANTELTKTYENVVVADNTLTIACMQGPAENPMLSAIIIKRTDGSDIPIGETFGGEGLGEKTQFTDKKFDHQAHAVAGDTYVATDFNNDGVADALLDGSLSHSHYNNPQTGESGYIAKYEWTVGDKLISNKQTFTNKFTIGVTDVKLTVTDQTGDVASAYTQVKVFPATAGGAYCYYYLGATTSDINQRPDEGHAANIIHFQNDEFPYSKKDNTGGNAVWATRCVTYFTSVVTKQYKFSIKYKGGGAILLVNGVQKIAGGPSVNALKTIDAVVTIGVESAAVHVVFFKSAATFDPSLTFLIDNFIAPPSTIGYRASEILPTISSISTSTASIGGGGQLQIIGTGFFNGVSVSIGNFKPEFILVSSSQIVVSSIPSAAQAAANPVYIIITNAAGNSNAFELKYTNVVKAGVAWDQTFFKTGSGGKFVIKQVTSVAIGPDGKYYMGSVSGFVTQLGVGKNLIVQSQCKSKKIGQGRAILGIALNPKSTALRVYVTTSKLYWGFGALGPDGWANGAVESFVGGCGCLCYEKKVISGLPVSNHDHGVNSLLFLNNGDLLISVGGSTNAGHNTPGNKLGGYPESPLSGAILIAKLSKGGGFNGKITYNQYGDSAAAVQTGGDVSVYAPGFRNCFGMTIRTNGQVWATDNGGNFGYGDVSVSCTKHEKFKKKMFDELNLVIPGSFYGHPNRNRKQCSFGSGVKPKATMVSSTPGVVEYTSNVFQGELKGELILAKYAASGSGKTWRTKVVNNNVNLIQMTDYSGLNVINGLHGELVMPRVQQGFIAVLKPKYGSLGTAPYVIAVSPRRGVAGMQVFVSGENFANGVVVKFGANVATDVKVVENGHGLFCKVPPGSGAVSVVVALGVQSSPVIAGYDFIYV
ncbi:hypothetical protein BWQ96_04473 [Gracilariopsis chorda]|uniref:Fibrocystin-L n=1 Tax=Gracilariopsis chorda TaxID=448386 RepID=A0A2V3IUB9_9FLOR|nr:hypothetical protein BWQ96_04473 [Gracilariopsis chorda]|eukprot:PXF45705.1 hypothetical protein BWQ96_04473 [Gracilariopsis chorda]